MYKLTSVCTAGLCNGKAADARLTGVAIDGELAIHKRADLANGVGHDGQFEENLITSVKITERKRRRKGKAGRKKESWALVVFFFSWRFKRIVNSLTPDD